MYITSKKIDLKLQLEGRFSDTSLNLTAPLYTLYNGSYLGKVTPENSRDTAEKDILSGKLPKRTVDRIEVRLILYRNLVLDN